MSSCYRGDPGVFVEVPMVLILDRKVLFVLTNVLCYTKSALSRTLNLNSVGI